jgi:hypothetical protein
MDHQFVFADETGNLVMGTTRDFLDLDALGYTYDSFEPAPAGFQPAVSSVPRVTAAAPIPSLFQTASMVPLGAGPARVVLTSSGPQPEMIRRLRTVAQRGRMRLVLRNLMATAQPGALYGVYLNLPQNAPVEDRGNFRVGNRGARGACLHAGPAAHLRRLRAQVRAPLPGRADLPLQPLAPGLR